jgi:hypothetical protein
MVQLNVRALACSFIVALLPLGVAAQPIATAFRDLQKLLKPGDYVVVIDKAANEIWGQAIDISGSSITVAEAVKSADRVTITRERRVFDETNVRAILRSDSNGGKGAAVYPPSWGAVDALPRDADVTVTLAGGERKRFRFGSVTADTFHVRTSAGQEETLKKTDILRVERHGVDDPVSDGIVIGSLIGVGTGFALMTAAYAACDGSCDAPAKGPMFLGAMGFGAGVGALTGWIIDKAHRGKATVFPVVAPIVTPDRKGVALSLRF